MILFFTLCITEQAVWTALNVSLHLTSQHLSMHLPLYGVSPTWPLWSVPHAGVLFHGNWGIQPAGWLTCFFCGKLCPRFSNRLITWSPSILEQHLLNKLSKAVMASTNGSWQINMTTEHIGKINTNKKSCKLCLHTKKCNSNLTHSSELLNSLIEWNINNLPKCLFHNSIPEMFPVFKESMEVLGK